MLFPYASGAFTKLIDVFIELHVMEKESVLYISMLEYISGARSGTSVNIIVVN